MIFTCSSEHMVSLIVLLKSLQQVSRALIAFVVCCILNVMGHRCALLSVSCLTAAESCNCLFHTEQLSTSHLVKPFVAFSSAGTSLPHCFYSVYNFITRFYDNVPFHKCTFSYCTVILWYIVRYLVVCRKCCKTALILFVVILYNTTQ